MLTIRIDVYSIFDALKNSKVICFGNAGAALAIKHGELAVNAGAGIVGEHLRNVALISENRDLKSKIVIRSRKTDHFRHSFVNLNNY